MLNIILSILLVVICVFVILFICLQEPKEEGLGGLTGISNSFVNHKRNKSVNRRLARVTGVLTAAFMIICVVISIVTVNG